MRIPMRNGEPLGLEEMQERQAQMEDQLNMATSEIQAKEAELIVLRAKVAAGDALRDFCSGYDFCNIGDAIAAYDAAVTP